MPDWLRKKDAKTGHFYYINKETREATWAKPADGRVEDAETGDAVDLKPPDDSGEGADEWLELKDPKTGRPYFMHPVSRRTSWIKPQETAGTGEDESDDKWLELKDPETGHAYFMHSKTRRTSWVKPDADGSQQGKWMKLKDPKTGQDYYMHPVTRRTSWVDPSRQAGGAAADSSTGSAPAPAGSSPGKAGTSSMGGASSLWAKTMHLAESDEAKPKRKVQLDVSSDAPQRENTPAHPVTPHPGPAEGSDKPEKGNDKWVELKDPKTGRYYYMHPQSRRTSWIKPSEHNEVRINEEGQVELKSANKDGWLELKDPSTGHPYYMHQATRRTSWVKPTELGGPDPAAGGNASGTAALSRDKAKAGAPSGAADAEEKVAFKVILVGNAGVGKTNLLRVAMDEKDGYDEECEPTLNPDFAALSIPHPDNANKQLQALVWDTAGQERYQAVTRSQYRRANGALVVFDTSDPKSFAALPRWLDQVTEGAGDTLSCVYIVENKVDLLPKGDVRSEARPAGFADLTEVQKFCNARGYKLFHTTAKMNSTAGDWRGTTAHEVLSSLVKNIYMLEGEQKQAKTLALSKAGAGKKKKSGCC